jgi:uncharacterized protein YjbJ (UPF0337 family)
MKKSLKNVFLLLLTGLILSSLACEKGCGQKSSSNDSETQNIEPKQAEVERELEYYQNKLKAEWDELKASIQQEWGKLTDDDLEQIQGNFKELAAKLQVKYYDSKQEAEDKIKQFLDKQSAR